MIKDVKIMNLLKIAVRAGIVICVTVFYGMIVFGYKIKNTGYPDWMITTAQVLLVLCVAILTSMLVFSFRRKK